MALNLLIADQVTHAWDLEQTNVEVQLGKPEPAPVDSARGQERVV